jgi:hypothetical protein
MISSLTSFFKKPPQRSTPVYQEPTNGSPLKRRDDPNKHSFSKVFRWRLPDGQTDAPSSVEIVGSFTKWQKVPLHRDGMLDAWHATVHHIPGNRTHHYMLLIDGQPVYDKTCDGLAIPHGFDEIQFQLATDKGPRVLMLFSHTK